MTESLKLATALPLIALLAGCVSGADNTADTTTEIEETLDTDIDGDGSVEQGGVEIGS